MDMDMDLDMDMDMDVDTQIPQPTGCKNRSLYSTTIYSRYELKIFPEMPSRTPLPLRGGEEYPCPYRGMGVTEYNPITSIHARVQHNPGHTVSATAYGDHRNWSDCAREGEHRRRAEKTRLITPV